MEPGSSTTGEASAEQESPHYCEAGASLLLGEGFFRPESRPSRDLGVLLARWLAHQPPQQLTVLDLMAGCGIRSLRYGREAGASAIWANDADPLRLPLLRRNLAELPQTGLRITALTAQNLLARCLIRQERFSLVDLDAFGCPTTLVAPALEVLRFGGVLYLASTDGRSPTGHDRPAAIRSLGAAARAHPASWELALRLQIGVVARAAWALGRGIRPLFSFSEGRTFRTAIQLLRRPESQQERLLGLLAHCHGCGDQQHQSLLQLRQWQPCDCPQQPAPPRAISGPLWLGPLQHPPSLQAMQALEASAVASGAAASAAKPALRLLRCLADDPGVPPTCWPTADLARRLQGGPPPLAALVEALRREGWRAGTSAVMAGQVRSDAPWQRILEVAAGISSAAQPPLDGAGTLNR